MTEQTDATAKGWVADQVRIVKTEMNGWCAFLDVEDEDGQRIGTINICRGIGSHDYAAELVRNWVRDLSASLYATQQPTQAQAGAVPLTCEWTHNADDSFWDTECGQSWRFDDGGPKENNMHFCHHCGKPVHIKGVQHGTDTRSN